LRRAIGGDGRASQSHRLGAARPTARAANRTFRLATSRWGGRYDVIVQRDADAPMSDFAASALKLADPDLIVSVDRELGGLDWSADLARLRIQPFDTTHLPEGARAHKWRPWLAGQPTVAEDDAALRVRAASGTTFDWKLAARYGLVERGSESLKAVADDDASTALEATSEGLTQRAALGRFVLFGPPGVPLAGRYWTLRALGARVNWLPERVIDPGLANPPSASATSHHPGSGARARGRVSRPPRLRADSAWANSRPCPPWPGPCNRRSGRPRP
jgi:hypothetical protein